MEDNILTRLLDLIGSFFNDLLRLPQLWAEDRSAFWITMAVIAAVAIIVVVVIALIRSGREERPEKLPSASTTFVPVEDSGESIQGTILSPEDRITSGIDGLDPVARRHLLDEAPQSLSTIVKVYERCNPAVRQDLTELVREKKLMENYAAGLQNGYPQGVLIEAWRLFPDEAVLRGFVNMLGSKDEDTQRAGVRLLSTLKEPKSLPLLVLALVRPETFPPARVAEVFQSMPKESVLLLTYILPELEDRHKRSVLEIISQIGLSYEPKNVLACLDNPDQRIRSAALVALGSGHITSALPRLLEAANDPDWQIRAAAAKALGLLGDSQALPVLEAMTHDKEGWVAENARQARDAFYQA